jgi:hypothetical protein
MLAGKANDIKQHRWFDGLDWEALAARKLEAPRRPQDDSAKRLKELTVLSPHFYAKRLWYLSVEEALENVWCVGHCKGK